MKKKKENRIWGGKQSDENGEDMEI
jgi:hypothetical protein